MFLALKKDQILNLMAMGNIPPSILNPFQRYPIYLTLHKILDGTASLLSDRCCFKRRNDFFNKRSQFWY